MFQTSLHTCLRWLSEHTSVPPRPHENSPTIIDDIRGLKEGWMTVCVYAESENRHGLAGIECVSHKVKAEVNDFYPGFYLLAYPDT